MWVWVGVFVGVHRCLSTGADCVYDRSRRRQRADYYQQCNRPLQRARDEAAQRCQRSRRSLHYGYDLHRTMLKETFAIRINSISSLLAKLLTRNRCCVVSEWYLGLHHCQRTCFFTYILHSLGTFIPYICHA